VAYRGRTPGGPDGTANVDGEGVPRTPPGTSLSATRAGRTLLDLVALALVAAMLVSNMPDSALRDRLVAFEQPITDVTGLSQSWALFAPTPRSTTLQLRAEIERTDGSVEEWAPPVGDRLVGVYRTYRWRKWAGFAVSGDRTALHRQAVRYLELRAAGDGRAPVAEIRLYRDVYRQPGVGSGEPLDRDPPFEPELLLRREVAVPGAAAEERSGGPPDPVAGQRRPRGGGPA
jgi:hypothetical protein